VSSWALVFWPFPCAIHTTSPGFDIHLMVPLVVLFGCPLPATSELVWPIGPYCLCLISYSNGLANSLLGLGCFHLPLVLLKQRCCTDGLSLCL
jgi:hypothetical protein